MKNIIVPTDFSENAKDALQYAINLANHFGSTIHLIHVYEVRSQTGMLLSIREFLQKEAEADLSKLVQHYKHHLLHDTQLEARAIEGFAKLTIAQFAKSKDADLIIMGTQGASGLKRVFFGSNTAAVMKKSESPILAIPQGYQYRPIKNITFAVDTKIINDSALLQPLIQLAQAYKAKVKVLHVEKTKELALVDPGIDIFLSDIDYSFHQIQGAEINSAIDRFSKETQSDMICMIRRERSILGQLFNGSVTQRETFQSEIPLLVLKED